MPFISFYGLIALARSSSIMFNKTVKSGHPCLALYLKGKAFSYPSLSKMIAVGFSYTTFIMLRYIPSMTNFLSFYRERMLNFVKCFFCIYWDDPLILIFHFVNVVCHIDWFTDVKLYLHLWNKSHLIMWCDTFNVLLNLFC